MNQLKSKLFEFIFVEGSGYWLVLGTSGELDLVVHIGRIPLVDRREQMLSGATLIKQLLSNKTKVGYASEPTAKDIAEGETVTMSLVKFKLNYKESFIKIGVPETELDTECEEIEPYFYYLWPRKDQNFKGVRHTAEIQNGTLEAVANRLDQILFCISVDVAKSIDLPFYVSV